MVAPRHNARRPLRRPAGAPAGRPRTPAGVALAVVAMAVGAFGWAPMAAADGTEVLGPPSIPVAEGSGVATGGTGMHVQPATMTVDVPAGATVEQVLLYWEGHFNTGDPDSTIVVEGNTVDGTLIGGPTLFFGDVSAAVYRADVTALGLVSPGANALEVSGLAFSYRNNGAGVLVIYDDGTDAVIDLRDGSDLAFVNFAPPLDTTVPQTFTFAPSPVDRTATLNLFAASVADGEVRPNALDVTVGGSTTRFTDFFSSNAGAEFDVQQETVTVPAGVTELTVQALSVGDGTPNLPASFNWLASMLTVAPPPEGPEPGATAALDCPAGVVGVTLANTGGTGTTFDVFRGQEKLNAEPIAVAAGGTEAFTYQLRPDDENTTVALRAVAATGDEFDLSTLVDCDEAGLLATLADACAIEDGVTGIVVALANEGTEAGTFTVPGRDPVTVGPGARTDVFLPVAEGAAYSFEITGPGGFTRTIAGTRECQAPQLGAVQVCAQDGTGVVVTVTNGGQEGAPVTLAGATRTVPAGGQAEFFLARNEDDPATTLTATSPRNPDIQVALPVQDCLGVLAETQTTQPPAAATTTTAPATTTTTTPTAVAGTQLARTGAGVGTALVVGLSLVSAGGLLLLGVHRRRTAG